MRTVGIIQARMDSERLPGKVLERIGDATVLGWVVYRTRQIKLDEIVVATTELPSDDAIVEECRFLDVECFRGPADDVLTRYMLAATEYGATHILRVTADCPMLDTWLNWAILDKLLNEPALSYVASSGWPKGIGQEAFTEHALANAFYGATSSADREHVVPWMIRNLKCAYLGGNMSVDTAADLAFLRFLYEREPGRFDRVLSPS